MKIGETWELFKEATPESVLQKGDLVKIKDINDITVLYQMIEIKSGNYSWVRFRIRKESFLANFKKVYE